MYRTGWGVDQDYVQAVKWYRLAATQGSPSAQFDLGMMYSTGKGVLRDFVQAAQWYQLAAAQGHLNAQQELGTMYGLGKGVMQDYEIAHMWLNLSAVDGDLRVVKLRDDLADRMTSAQVANAQKMARECLARKFKKCGGAAW